MGKAPLGFLVQGSSTTGSAVRATKIRTHFGPYLTDVDIIKFNDYS